MAPKNGNILKEKMNRLAGQKLFSAEARKTRETPKTAKPKTTKSSQEKSSQRIGQKAYELYERRGWQPGWEMFDWALAEELIRLESTPQKSKKTSLDPAKLEEKIRKKAYDLFERSGYRPGNEMFNWVLAREIVKLEIS